MDENVHDDGPEREKPGGEGSAEGAGAPLRDERYLLGLFVGRNEAPFLKIYDDLHNAEGKKRNIRWSRFNWTAALFSTPWFFYRKLYLEGTVLILVPIVIAYLFPALAGKGSIGMAVVVGLLANQYYVDRALKKIAAVERRDMPVEGRDETIRRIGGVSVPGAVIGAVIAAGLIAVAILSIMASSGRGGAAAAFPECDDAGVKAAVARLFRKGSAPPDLTDPQYAHTGFKQTGMQDESTRLCRFLVNKESGPVPVRFMIKKDGAGKGRPTVSLLWAIRKQ